MPIVFDSLPKENPFSLPTPGVYKAKIAEASMKKSKTDSTKPPYLNMKLELFDNTGKKAGVIFDMLSESDSSVVQYKIGRFLTACGIPLVGQMELSDIAKIVVNKEIAVDITIDHKANPERAVVDLFSRQAYYPMSEYAAEYAATHMEPPSENDFAALAEVPADAPEEQPFDGTAETPDGNVEY